MYPILFHLGPFPVRAWGLFVAIGIILGTWVAYREARRQGLNPDKVLDFTIFAVVAGLFGARAWEVVFSWPDFAGRPLEAFKFWDGGLSIQGGVAGGLIALVFFIRLNRISFWQWADVLAPGLVLGQGIGRIGCFFNGDAFGKPTNSWLGIVYHPSSPAYAAYGSQPLLPMELFEAGWDLALFALFLLLRQRRPFHGYIALLYFILYSAGRFTLEFWRGDSLLTFINLKVAQVASVSVLTAAIIIFAWHWRRNRLAD